MNFHENGVLQRLPVSGMMDRPLHQERTGSRIRVGIGAGGTEPQNVPADRTCHRALENRRFAMRAGAGLARNRRAVRLHTPDPVFAFSCDRTLVNLALSESVQPNSTLPRMREPAATVNIFALRSPMTWPDSRSLTSALATTFPSNSPPMVTVSALIFAVRWAPFSIFKIPLILTSPLNFPAIRTCASPSIFPSIVTPGPKTDS